ncbi:MAG: hypothetical protein LBK64_08415 [Spirochaetaceae bacterium]|nr:hypothetical protein [Spirochaetaceae bacterium]
MENQDPRRAPDCLKCLHFHVTWDAAFPRGCTLFGVKSRNLPSIEVYKATGRHCPSFEARPIR